MIEKLREFFTGRVQKIFLLTVSALSTLFVALLFFVPFCMYSTDVKSTTTLLISFEPLSASNAVAIMGDELASKAGMTVISLIVLLLYLAMLIVSLAFLVKLVLSLNRDIAKVKRNAFWVLLLATVFSGGYSVVGFLFDLINRANGGLTSSANNLWPFVVIFVIDGISAVMYGLTYEKGKELKEEEQKENKAERKKLLIYKIELFAYATGIFLLALVSFLTNIVTIVVKGTVSVSVKLDGAKILGDYISASQGGQVLAFVLFICIVTVTAFYLLSLLSLFGNSKSFFRLAILSVIASCSTSFLVGMYGKYYEIIQAINIETIESWLKLANVVIPSAGLSSIKYTVTSSSIYFFIAAFAVAGVLIVRKPYSKGLAVQNKLYPSENVFVAKFEGGSADYGLGGNDNKEDTLEERQEQAVEQPSSVAFSDPCPTFTELDYKQREFNSEVEHKKSAFKFESLSLANLVEFIVQYARDSRLHLFYTTEDVATFIAGLGTTRLSILQGMSGTGKTSLPKIFCEALYSNCEIVEVESSWRDKNELLGYYNEFSKSYTPKKFTEALYKACLNPQTITFIVLDEMNLSRIEYYFSDFLSLMENEPDKREIKLVNVALSRTVEGKKISYKALKNGHTLKVLPNVWFIGTANRDESTYEISDKVYDRAHTMNFNKRAKAVRHYNDELSPRFVTVEEFNALLENAKKSTPFSIEGYPIIAQVEKLLEPYNISFGNRIAKQIESFVSIYCACFASSEAVLSDAVERILLSKVVSKLELKSVEDKAELASQFEELGLRRCSEFISKLNED